VNGVMGGVNPGGWIGLTGLGSLQAGGGEDDRRPDGESVAHSRMRSFDPGLEAIVGP